MANVAHYVETQRARRRARITGQINTGLFTTSDPEFAGLTEDIRRRRELSQERAKQNAFLKALRLGRFGQRSLLSGSFAGITDELAAAAALAGTRPGASVGAAAGTTSTSTTATSGGMRSSGSRPSIVRSGSRSLIR